MPIERLDMLIWLLIYGGMIAICLGVAIERGGQALGWVLVIGGAAAVAAGAILIWVRSRTGEAIER